MRSLGWTLIQYKWCPYKKEKFGNKTQREDGYLPAREQGLAHHLSSHLSGESALPTPWASGLLDRETPHFCGLSLVLIPGLWYFVTEAPAN